MPTDTPSATGRNLLLVEDQLDLADLVEHALVEDGSSVTHAYSVFEALSLLDKDRYDGAVLDVELRDGVVFPVADRLVEMGIPFVFASAVYEQLVPARHREAPFLAKPFHVQDLQQAVNQALQRASGASAQTGAAGVPRVR